MLTSCQAADDRICSTPPKEPARGDYAGCVHRWAYRLARSPETKDQIATAVVAACEDAIDASLLDSKLPLPSDPKVFERIHQDREERAKRQALFHITQAKAGDCDIP
jgi:hypothetical protein